MPIIDNKEIIKSLNKVTNRDNKVTQCGRVLFIRSTWKLLFCIFSGSLLKSSHNFIPPGSITIMDHSNLVYLL